MPPSLDKAGDPRYPPLVFILTALPRVEVPGTGRESDGSGYGGRSTILSTFFHHDASPMARLLGATPQGVLNVPVVVQPHAEQRKSMLIHRELSESVRNARPCSFLSTLDAGLDSPIGRDRGGA